jgi:hypothetical protein
MICEEKIGPKGWEAHCTHPARYKVEIADKAPRYVCGHHLKKLKSAMSDPPKALAALTTIEAKATEALLVKYDAIEAENVRLRMALAIAMEHWPEPSCPGNLRTCGESTCNEPACKCPGCPVCKANVPLT